MRITLGDSKNILSSFWAKIVGKVKKTHKNFSIKFFTGGDFSIVYPLFFIIKPMESIG